MSEERPTDPIKEIKSSLQQISESLNNYRNWVRERIEELETTIQKAREDAIRNIYERHEDVMSKVSDQMEKVTSRYSELYRDVREIGETIRGISLIQLHLQLYGPFPEFPIRPAEVKKARRAPPPPKAQAYQKIEKVSEEEVEKVSEERPGPCSKSMKARWFGYGTVVGGAVVGTILKFKYVAGILAAPTPIGITLLLAGGGALLAYLLGRRGTSHNPKLRGKEIKVPINRRNFPRVYSILEGVLDEDEIKEAIRMEGRNLSPALRLSFDEAYLTDLRRYAERLKGYK
jgi:DNA-directed RNA polymerase subunit L